MTTVPHLIDLVADRLAPIVYRPAADPLPANPASSAADALRALIERHRFAELALQYDAEEEIRTRKPC